MTKKNVLVVSEQFTRGGLETHIQNQVVGLSDRVNFVFAFGVYEENDKLKNNKVYDIGSFSRDYTVADFHRQVEQLLKIVEDEKIDVIHAHPFLSLLPAMFVSVLSGKPIIYTLHGGPSLSSYSDVFSYNFLQRFFFSYLDQQIISVRKEFEDVRDSYGMKNYHYIPNSLIAEDYAGLKRSNNNKWALLARLDNESQTAVFEIIDKMDILGIDTIDIYGTGWAEGIITEHIKERGLVDKVRLRGWSDGVVGALKTGAYEGVIGHGQVALDGLAAGYPVLLLSYGRISGLIDKSLYNEVKRCNFVNIYYKSVTNEELILQFDDYHKKPDRYILDEDVLKEFDNNKIQDQYLRVIYSARHKYATQVADVWARINELVGDGASISNEKVLESWAIEEIIEACFLRYGFVVRYDLVGDIYRNRRYRNIESTIGMLRQEIVDQAQQIHSLATIRNSSKLLVKSIKKKFSK